MIKDPLLQKIIEESTLDEREKNKDFSKESLYELHIACVVFLLLLANVFAKKVVPIYGGFDLALSGIFFGLTFLPLMLISDVYGYSRCAKVIIGALIAQFLFIILVWLCANIGYPSDATHQQIQSSNAFQSYFSSYGQVLLGSMVAVAISYYFFTLLNSWFKVRFCSFSLPIRFLISVGISKLLLVFIAYPINLIGMYSSFWQILKICLTTWVIKMFLAIIVLFIAWILVPIVRRVEEKSTFDIGVEYSPLKLLNKNSSSCNFYEAENRIINQNKEGV